MFKGATPMFHKSFVDMYFIKLKDAAETKIVNADEALLRPTKFPMIEEIVETIWLTLMARLAAQKEIQIGKYQLLTKLGILFFKQSFMAKRIDGAIAIDMVCKRALQQDHFTSKDTKKDDTVTNVVPALIQTLQESNIIDLYFGKQNIHDQLVMRAEGVLGLFLANDVLSAEQIDMIWRNCYAEDAIYRNLIASLGNLSSKVKPALLTTLIERVASTPRNKIKNDEIELMSNLCYEGSTVNLEDEPIIKINQSKVLEFYWEYLTGEGADK